MLRNIEEFSGIKESKYGRHISNKWSEKVTTN